VFTTPLDSNGHGVDPKENTVFLLLRTSPRKECCLQSPLSNGTICHNTVAYRVNAKQRLFLHNSSVNLDGKQQLFLRNSPVNMFPLLGSRFLIMQQLDYNNENGVSTSSVPRWYKQGTKSVESEFCTGGCGESSVWKAAKKGPECVKLKNLQS
jgi:hypothetical protein